MRASPLEKTQPCFNSCRAAGGSPAEVVNVLNENNEPVLDDTLNNALLLDNCRVAPTHSSALAGGKQVVHMLHGQLRGPLSRYRSVFQHPRSADGPVLHRHTVRTPGKAGQWSVPPCATILIRFAWFPLYQGHPTT